MKKGTIPQILLTGLSIIGTIAAPILAVKATPKVEKLLDEASREKVKTLNDPKPEDLELTPTEKVKVVWKEYLPATGACVGTVACIVGLGILNKRSQASLSSAYALTSQLFGKYRHKVEEYFGKETEQKIFAEAAEEVVIRDYSNLIEDAYTYDRDMDRASEEVLCYYMDVGRYFNTTMAALINAQYHVNRNLLLRGYVTLNEFLSFLGIKKDKDGDVKGWSYNDMATGGLFWLDFGNKKTDLDDGMECIVVTPIIPAEKFSDEELDEIEF